MDVETSAEPRVGLGHDQPRRTLSDEDMTGMILSERDELADAATPYRDLGLMDEVADLERQARIVER